MTKFEIPDDWFVDHDGQRLVLDPEKVAAEIERQQREIGRLEKAIAVWRTHSYEVGRLLASHDANSAAKAAQEANRIGKDLAKGD